VGRAVRRRRDRELRHVGALRRLVVRLPGSRRGPEPGRQAKRSGGELDAHEEYAVGFEGRLRDRLRGGLFAPSQLEAALLLPDLAGSAALAADVRPPAA
jgi:hypothetical protein